MAELDIGVPGALAEAVRRLVEAVSPSSLDRLWIFPPRARGRTERGLVAAGCYVNGDRRLLVTLAYRAEENGGGVAFHPVFQEEGEAPSDRLPRVMEGVVRRSQEALGPPRAIALDGDPETLRALLDELAPDGPAAWAPPLGSTQETAR